MRKAFCLIPLCIITILSGCNGGGNTTVQTNTVVFDQISAQEQTINQALSEKEFKKGMIRFYNREYQAAIQLFNKALALDPMNSRARYYLGYSYLNSGYAQNAIEEWENLINLGGGNYQVKQKLNDLYFRLSIDKQYDYAEPYILSRIYDGIAEGSHKIVSPSFIVYDEQSDTFLISCVKTKYVVEMDGNGYVKREFGRRFGDFSSFGMPMGIALYGDRVYIADFQQDAVFRFTRDGKYVSKFGISGYESSNLSGPLGIYISDDDYLYVVDNGNHRVQKFDLDGNWVQSFGVGDLHFPTDVTGSGENIFVSDTGNSRIVQYDKFGNVLRIIQSEQIQKPRGIAIRENLLYITDADTGLYIYDLASDRMEKMGVDEGNLVAPFDVCLDKNRLIYETDLNTQNIGIFIPLELRYANLGIDISQVWIDNYPKNLLYFRVWDKAGNPIYDLTEENIAIYELGESIPLPKIGSTYQFRQNMYINFIVDKSLAMETYTSELKDILNPFLEKMSGSDWLNIVLADDTVRSSGRIDANVLWTMDYILKEPFASPAPADLGGALYDSITGLLNIYRNKAIVLITSGAAADSTFAVYDEQVITTYARQNAVPIYVISMTHNNEDAFRRIAEGAFGKYYTLDDIRYILTLYDEIKNSKPLEYILSYDGLNLFGLKNFWVDIHLKIRYKSMIGVDDTGYYVPETVARNIDLERENPSR